MSHAVVSNHACITSYNYYAIDYCDTVIVTVVKR
jgi:hypothetical protein